MEKIAQQKLRFGAWTLSQVFLPIATFGLLTFFYFMKSIPNPLMITFGSPDFSFYGALLLLGSVVELYCGQKSLPEDPTKIGIHLMFIGNICLSAVIFIFYGYCKNLLLSSNVPQPSPLPENNIILIGYVIIISGIFSVCWTIYTNYYLAKYYILKLNVNGEK